MPVYFLEIIVVALGLVMLMVDAFVKLEDKRSIAWIGMLGLSVVFLLLFQVKGPENTDAAFWQFYSANDTTALFFKGIAVLTTLIVLVMAVDYSPVVVDQTAKPEKGAHPQSGLGEFFALPMFACAGLMWMASANNLVSIFVSLEAVTITFYILVTYLRRNVGSLEAGVKYLILGALSTGFLVYGFAWLFGITGSMDLAEITTALGKGDVNTTAALFAFALILMASAFKVGAAPFHLWIPDVYQGAPTPITAFLSVGSKAAGFIVFLRLATPFLASAPLVGKVTMVLTVVAALTLLFGNFSAIPQKNFKRLLAYSSIAHAGFLMMALASAPEKLVEGSELTPVNVIAFYLGAYLLMTLLAFLVMSTMRKVQVSEEIDSYRGLAKRSPFLAFALLISMASLAGIPLTAGFFGKFFVFQLAVAQQQWLLVVVGLIGAGAGFYYYLKIAASMYLSPTEKNDDTSAIAISPLSRVTMIALIVAIIAAGFAPGLIFGLMG
ncbi:NADH-quinone oxidoreductase subunit N [Verrucomicrobiales bacterium BCK34]|nr:NADH-quinone oxidoreductase subunit N [Verrucomicrobiales bacterium BCK34]